MHNKKIGFWEAYSIGIGGMIGGGIFAVLGLTILLSRGAAPVAFIFAGIIALLTSYSYAKLSVRYPSEGGTVEYLVRAFGNNLITGYLNTLLLAAYVIMLSLYSYAFGSYASALFLGYELELAKKLFIALVIIFFTVINALGAYISGKAEDIMVFMKVGILLFFSVLGFLTGDFSKLSPEHWESIIKIMTGGLIIFLAYEGFELIANTAQDVEDPEKTLPKAFYAAVTTVIFIYVLVSTVAVANLTYEEVQKYQDYALAVAAKPFLGQAGFVLIGIAALLSTASAINATLYGSARVSYLIAKFGALPKNITRQLWKNATEGLVILAILTIIFATTFNLENISIAGSLGFLIIFAGVNLANVKLSYYTDSNKLISFIAFLMCVISIFVLIGYNLKTNPHALESSLVVLVLTLLFEISYRFFTKIKLQKFIDWRLEEREKYIQQAENYINKISTEIKKNIPDAEVYLAGNFLKKGKSKAGHINLYVFSEQNKDKIEQHIQNIEKKLNLPYYHPFNIKILRKSQKNELEKEHKKIT
ncbi:amino acid:proton symporter, ABT family [Persephonella hydrogeniphila]|uniref:Amino acid:proton symporter, ABT family n=1 Tax=Persephonella hydrogeniphila TaxID=198703 RepID=A0A285NAG6_9AQUI|nr:APC family permease [Persephonella hydrogeniphila]SNZ06430.1 amino acid:proton symporter, ABT family [Persephonella hydrogeniphila]